MLQGGAKFPTGGKAREPFLADQGQFLSRRYSPDEKRHFL